MTSNAFTAVGTQFKRGDGENSEVFTAIAEVKSINGPNLTRATVDVTSLDSTGGYREFIGGFRDGGEVSLDMNFTQTGYAVLLGDLETETTVNYQIVHPAAGGGGTFDFAGLITGINVTHQGDQGVMASVTIKISGQTTFTS
jgi:predicted secreted protein